MADQTLEGGGQYETTTLNKEFEEMGLDP